jgi:hypothetical protein
MHVGTFCDEKLEKGSEVVGRLRRSEETTLLKHILVVMFTLPSLFGIRASLDLVASVEPVDV